MEGRKEGACDDRLRPRLILSEMEANPPVPELKKLLCKLGAIHQAQRALTDGVYRELLLTNRQYAFTRILGNEAVVTAVNNDANPVHMEINCPVSASGAQEALTGTDAEIRDGRIIWEMPAYGSAVFILK